MTVERFVVDGHQTLLKRDSGRMICRRHSSSLSLALYTT